MIRSLHYIGTLTLLLLLPLVAKAQTSSSIHVPWSCGFEEIETAELSQWVLNSGTDNATDQWCIGKAIRSEGKQSLYISTDDGATASFGAKHPNTVMAYRRIKFPEGFKEYDISFDWRNQSEGKLYVFFDYSSTLIDNVSDEYNIARYMSSTSGNSIPKKVLDKARYVYSASYRRNNTMTSSKLWMNVAIDAGAGTTYSERVSTKNSKKEFALVFVWVNTNQSMENITSGACIDNVQIASAYYKKPTGLAYATECADSSITVTWDGGLDNYLISYRKSTNYSWRQVSYQGSLYDPSFTVTGLKDATYDFKIQGWKTYVDPTSKQQVTDTFASSTINGCLLYCPENQCINYADLKNAVCTYGPYTDLFTHHKMVDEGQDNVLSLHTVNTDQGAYDLRTGNKLKIIPEGEVVSIRLGNWYDPAANKKYHGDILEENEQLHGQTITYDLVVDTTTSAILLLKYAMVFEVSTSGEDDRQSSHITADQPFFRLHVEDEYGTTIGGTCGTQFFSYPFGSDMDPEQGAILYEEQKWQRYGKENWEGRQNEELGLNSDNIFWKDWSTMGLNLNDYHDQHLRVVIETQGCNQSAHYGYGYFTLSCASASIETDQCGPYAEAAADAPEGFNYTWFKEKNRDLYEKGIVYDADGNKVIVSRDQTIAVESGDDDIYVCRLAYKDAPDCYFELNTRLSPRDAYPNFTCERQYGHCVSTLVLQDSSYVCYYNKGGSITLTPEPCEVTDWEVQSLTSGKKKKGTGTIFTFEAVNTGDTIRIEQHAWISECDQAKIDTIIMPDITTPDSLVRDTVCYNHVYSFEGQTFSRKDTVYHALYQNQYGCDSVITLDLHVVPTSSNTVVDTISSDMYPYLLTGQYHHRDTVYQLGNLQPYATSQNKIVSFDNQYGCDSTVTVRLTLIPVISVTVDYEDYTCFENQGEIWLSYQLHNGDYDSLQITFYDENMQPTPCLTPITDYHDPYRGAMDSTEQVITISYPDTLLPALYYARMEFFQHKICGDNQVYLLPLDIRYSSSIIQQKWNDVLTVLAPEYNGGYTFTAYQWFCDGDTIAGATMSYLYQPSGLLLGHNYYVELTSPEGIRQITCDFLPEDRSDKQVRPFPTLQQQGKMIAIHMAYAGQISYYTMLGKLYASYNLPAGTSTIYAPNTVGTYIMRVQYDNGEADAQQILVIP